MGQIQQLHKQKCNHLTNRITNRKAPTKYRFFEVSKQVKNATSQTELQSNHEQKYNQITNRNTIKSQTERKKKRKRKERSKEKNKE